MQPSRLNAYVFYEVLEQDEFSSSVVITFQVMAVSGVSPGNPDAIGAVSKRCQDELGAYPG